MKATSGQQPESANGLLSLLDISSFFGFSEGLYSYKTRNICLSLLHSVQHIPKMEFWPFEKETNSVKTGPTFGISQ